MSQKLIQWLWGDTTKEERRLVRKLDRSAFANAYVAGLKEAAGLHGRQFNVLLSMTSAGMLIGQIPNSLAIQKVAPRIWLPSMIILWAGLTMAGAGCKNFTQLCVVRFFMGMAEASTYAGCIYVMGCWYKPNEMAKRTAIFTIFGQLGIMFAGAMMAALSRTMEGRAGLAGWKWLFIINGIITLPIAVFGFIYFPDTPEKTKASWLNARERELALSRLPPKKEGAHNISPLSLAKRVLAHPTFYVCCFFSFLAAAFQSYPVQGLMLLYLKFNQKKEGYTQAQINTYPLGVQGVAVLSELVVAIAIDHFNLRVTSGLALCAIQLACTLMLLIRNTNSMVNIAALYLAGSAYGINPLLYGWSNNIAAKNGDDAARGVILASMVASGMLLSTFWGIALYPADAAPYWRNGYISMIVVITFIASWQFVLRWLDRRTSRTRKDSEESLNGEQAVGELSVEAKHGRSSLLHANASPCSQSREVGL
ncbi:MFS general substrate transporter [Aaosphaeria arxii CBS 175.79]|uniref:MFS general substrate transporter n=1 Tax=Aaosphaeria arxii CBS 175.79 TaxID=1450172 RepID=A0A6A5XR71_9PLEO|nr:MFS general substrate transporter [Aaosphaeria arxii CBS 175.79]KAF2015795.1 MFS general substrate transporter [Aaosphaeria arxii CBS 175.79]